MTARRVPSIRFGVAGLLLAGAVLPHARCNGRATGPLTMRAYVWQRVWTPDVSQAVGVRAWAFDRLVLLAAQVDQGDRVVDVACDYTACQGPVGLAVRITPVPTATLQDPRFAALIARVVRERVAAARAAGVEPVELQLDFDAGESQLGEYAWLVERLRPAVAPVPLTITALPSWLDQPAFARLAESCAAYTLQVHGLGTSADKRRLTILDPAAARRAVERAGKLGRPFDVALPTFGWQAGVAPDGKVLGLVAEGRARAWPAGTRLIEVQSDPAALAGLVGAWTADRPAALRALVWYRLPVDGDERNWTWPTLAAVMAGQTPRATIRIDAPRGTLVDLVAFNAGTADALLPGSIVVKSTAGARTVAADGANGYAVLDRGPDRVRLTTDAPAPLRPGESRPLGWVRFDRDTEVACEIAD